jgi:hypothetical protein
MQEGSNMDIMVTALTAGLLALFYIVLSARVIRLRTQNSISLGDGGNEALLRAVRGHGNFAEYAPIGVLLLLIAELQTANHFLLVALAAALFLGRICHGYAFGFTASSPFLRRAGMILTFGAIVSLAITNLVVAIPFS